MSVVEAVAVFVLLKSESFVSVVVFSIFHSFFVFGMFSRNSVPTLFNGNDL
jgi:hypothetical protein